MGESGISSASFVLMYIGEYHHTLDDKGRIAVPVKFRALCERQAVLARGLDHSLALFSRESWEAFVAELQSNSWAQAETRAATRLFLAGAADIELDRSGRMLVPEHLRTYASLTREVVFLGLGNRVELWDASAWKTMAEHAEANANAIAATLARFTV